MFKQLAFGHFHFVIQYSVYYIQLTSNALEYVSSVAKCNGRRLQKNVNPTLHELYKESGQPRMENQQQAS